LPLFVSEKLSKNYEMYLTNGQVSVKKFDNFIQLEPGTNNTKTNLFKNVTREDQEVEFTKRMTTTLLVGEVTMFGSSNPWKSENNNYLGDVQGTR
jgi:hypothetical protein